MIPCTVPNAARPLDTAPRAPRFTLAGLARSAAVRASSLALCVALALSGCETVKVYTDETVRILTNAWNATGDWLMGRQAGSLEDDGTSCFASERLPFYQAVDNVTSAQRLEYAAIGGAAVATFAALYADSIAVKVVAVGFAVTMAGVIASIEADNSRIKAVSDTFNKLLACRKGDVTRINNEYKNRKLTKDAAQEQLAKLRALMIEDVAVAQGANAILSARTEGFELSAQRAQQKAKPPANATESRERKQTEAKANAAVQSNQEALERQATTIKQAEALTRDEGVQLSRLREQVRIQIAAVEHP